MYSTACQKQKYELRYKPQNTAHNQPREAQNIINT